MRTGDFGRCVAGRAVTPGLKGLILAFCLASVVLALGPGSVSGPIDSSRASELASLETRAPQPSGILPCAERRVVLTSVYRHGNRLRFEGFARFSLRGETIRLHSGGEEVASAEVEAVVGIGRIRRVVLARQTGCRKHKAVGVKQTGSGPDGRVRARLPRPAKGQPYAIYRLRTKGGTIVSSPVVVRPSN